MQMVQWEGGKSVNDDDWWGKEEWCIVVRREKRNYEPFSTAERSERVENFLFRATCEYTEAGIEQRCLGDNSPEPRRRAVIG